MSMELQSIEREPLSKSFYSHDALHEPTNFASRVKARWRARFSGWRGGVIAAIGIAAFVLLLNVVFAVVAATVWNPADGIATAYIGDCTAAARWTTATHLLINLLSSLLLGASNYCMQRLVAPTRKEIDQAHAQKKWLDIGMPSVRNLASISKSRLALWILLASSSIPLHFLYNSVVFETIGANDVDFLVVAPEFFTNKTSWSYLTFNSTWDNFITRLQDTLLDNKYLDRTAFENITGTECIARYTSSFISSGAGFGVPLPDFRKVYGLNATRSVLTAQSGSGELSLQSYNIEGYSYCLSQITPSKCQIQFSQTILYIVITCNILKISGMALILLWHNHETIVTVGDAIKSFLQRPDHTTNECCLMSRRNVDRLWEVPEARYNQRFQPKNRESWFGACSTRRWCTALFLYFASIATAAGLSSIITANTSQINRNGFGRVDTRYLIDILLPFGDKSVLPFVLLANLPQAIISFIYLTYNGLFTAMLANREWSQYSIKRASLRVTLPSPGQRSTYFLQLPYTFSVPLLVASILLHWFVSQSIFLARIAIYKDGTLVTIKDRLTMYNHLSSSNGVFTGVGYSDSALLASIGWGATLVATCLLVAGFCTYPKGIPLGGTNSAVISAACHMKDEKDGRDGVEEDVADSALQWGVTIPGTRDRVGHCSFSNGEVHPPRVGCLYAGICTNT